MTLTVKIKHNGNPHKAGKMTVTDSDGHKVLSQVAVAIPSNINNISYTQNLKLLSVVIDNSLIKTSLNVNVEKNNYQDSFANLTKNGRYDTFVIANSIVFVNAESMVLHNDRSAFVLDKASFDKLVKAIKENGNVCNLEVKRTPFVFFTDKVVVDESKDVNAQFEKFKRSKDLLAKAIKTKQAEKEEKEEEERNQERKRKEKEKRQAAAVASRASSVNNDPMNDLLAFYNPALALMFRPHSTLAWFLYFSEAGNAVSQDVIDNNIHEISGFENVGSCEFENTRNGYTVALFSDEDKTEQIGTINVDTQSNCYELTTSSGEKNVVYPTDDGKINLSFVSESGSATKVEMVQNGDSFIGNWSSDNAGAAISAALTIDSQFNFESEVGKTNDLSGFLYQDSPNDSFNTTSVFSDNSSVSDVQQTFDRQMDFQPSVSVSQDNSFSSPASDTTSWASSDPYSN